MADGKRAVLIAAVAGILGTTVGAAVGGITAGFMTAHVQQEDRRLRWAQDSYQFSKGASDEEIQIRQFVDQLRNLSMMSSDTVKRLADVTRTHPGCSDKFTDSCRKFWVDGILAMRQELKSGPAVAEDVDLLLREKYKGAEKAFERIKAAQ